jgi:hydrogenase maturation protease
MKEDFSLSSMDNLEETHPNDTGPDQPGSILVIGIGNDFRGDDGVGRFVVRKLRDLNLPGVAVLEAEGDPLKFLEKWQGAHTVVLVDAVSSGAAPGTVFYFEAVEAPLPQELLSPCSTHALGLGAAIELARALGKLPPRLIVYGIEGKNFQAASGLSVEVEQAGEKVVHLLGAMKGNLQPQGCNVEPHGAEWPKVNS